MNLLDWVMIIFIIYTSIRGYMQGLAQSLFSLMGYLFAAAITKFYYPAVKAMLINLTTLDEWLAKKVIIKLTGLGAQPNMAAISHSDLNAVNQLSYPKAMKDQLITSLTDSANQAAMSLVDRLTDLMMTFFSIVFLFVLILLAVKIFSALADVVTKLPVIKSFNKLGGTFFGFAIGYVILSLFVLMGMPILSTFNLTTLQNLYDGSLGVYYLVNYNLLLAIIGQVVMLTTGG